MDMLVVCYAICALRTNAVFFTIFLTLIAVFSCLTAGFWCLAQGDASTGNRLLFVSKSNFPFVHQK